jgi:hypothetical protein
MLGRCSKAALWGALIGLFVGLLWGGLGSAVRGQAFSGATGMKAFLPGMLFPGLVLFAPFTAVIGAALGAGFVWFRMCRDECDTPGILAIPLLDAPLGDDLRKDTWGVIACILAAVATGHALVGHTPIFMPYAAGIAAGGAVCALFATNKTLRFVALGANVVMLLVAAS